jgi:chromate transporter
LSGSWTVDFPRVGPAGYDEETDERIRVVGVIANLGHYFAVHTLFAGSSTVTTGPLHLVLPDLATIRPVPVVIAVVATVLIFRLKWSVLRVLGVCAALGLVAGLAGIPGVE